MSRSISKSNKNTNILRVSKIIPQIKPAIMFNDHDSPSFKVQKQLKSRKESSKTSNKDMAKRSDTAKRKKTSPFIIKNTQPNAPLSEKSESKSSNQKHSRATSSMDRYSEVFKRFTAKTNLKYCTIENGAEGSERKEDAEELILPKPQNPEEEVNPIFQQQGFQNLKNQSNPGQIQFYKTQIPPVEDTEVLKPRINPHSKHKTHIKRANRIKVQKVRQLQNLKKGLTESDIDNKKEDPKPYQEGYINSRVCTTIINRLGLTKRLNSNELLIKSIIRNISSKPTSAESKRTKRPKSKERKFRGRKAFYTRKFTQSKSPAKLLMRMTLNSRNNRLRDELRTYNEPTDDLSSDMKTCISIINQCTKPGKKRKKNKFSPVTNSRNVTNFEQVRSPFHQEEPTREILLRPSTCEPRDTYKFKEMDSTSREEEVLIPTSKENCNSKRLESLNTPKEGKESEKVGPDHFYKMYPPIDTPKDLKSKNKRLKRLKKETKEFWDPFSSVSLKNINKFRDANFTNKYQVSIDKCKRFKLIKRVSKSLGKDAKKIEISSKNSNLNKFLKEGHQEFFIKILNNYWFKDCDEFIQTRKKAYVEQEKGKFKKMFGTQ
ncbi:unnamed protein product [Moneuplotes crassus]|uniref:Uncharacterized protein n=1 Tax=Euplotes crassus TaxID=5936 RepID=A0AAD2D2C9_EUPCR|nr:unnamed protein product [Moneuplotes crassus]